MKIIARSLSFCVAFVGAAVFAAVPPVSVTVTNSGKTSYKGRTDAGGAFATGKLAPGNYVVQFNSSSADLKGKQFAVVIAAGKKKVTASVAGEKFAGGGVAMKVDVGAGLNITGQVAASDAPLSKSGKKMVWIPKQLGSNMPGHWVEEDSAEAVAAKNAGNLSTKDINRMQESSGQKLGGN